MVSIRLVMNGGNYSQNTKQNTGSNETWKANNIYDLAGNCWEWTKEANNTDYRAACGGDYGIDGDYSPLTTYHNFSAGTDRGNSVSSRPVLYIK